MKSPCPRCGKVVSVTRYGSARHEHKCPRGVQCYPSWGKPCEECKAHWDEFRHRAGVVDLANQQSIARQAKAGGKGDGGGAS